MRSFALGSLVWLCACAAFAEDSASVADAGMHAALAAPSTPSGPAPSGPAPSGPAPSGPAPSGPRKGPTLSAEEQEMANVPGLIKQRDGTFLYEGRGFDAVIERNGDVRMRNVYARSSAVVKPKKMLNEQWATMFFESRYDIFGWLEKKFGNEPYHNQKRAFLESSLPLRARLAARLAVETLSQALSQIWSKTGLQFAERRQLTFELWDQSADDELGRIGRAHILAFVREHCPAGDVRGYTEDELRTANARRKSKAMFEPYTAPSR